MFQITFRSTSDGHLVAATTLHGENSLEKGATPGTVSVFRRPEPEGQCKSLLQITQEPGKLQEYSFKAGDADDKMTLEIGVGSAVPIAISRIKIMAKLVAGFGIKVVEKGNRVLAERVSEGSAAAEAGLKEGDVLQAINGKPVRT